MRGNQIRLGSASLLFAVVMLCVMLLSVLSLVTAKADMAVTENYRDHVTAWYEGENAAQNWLSETDAVLQQRGASVRTADLSDGAKVKQGVISVNLKHSGMEKEIRLRIRAEKNQRYEILTWRTAAQWQEKRSLTLWKS